MAVNCRCAQMRSFIVMFLVFLLPQFCETVSSMHIRSASAQVPRAIHVNSPLTSAIALRTRLRGGGGVDEGTTEFGPTLFVDRVGDGQGTVIWLHDYGGSGADTAASSGRLREGLKGCAFVFPTAPERPVTPGSTFSMRNWLQTAASLVAGHHNISSRIEQCANLSSTDWELLADPTAEREPPARLKCSVPLTTPSSLPRSQAPPANIYLRAGEAQRMRETEVRAQVEEAAAHIHTLVSNLIQNGTDPQHIMLVGHGQAAHVVAFCAVSLPYRLAGLVLLSGTVTHLLGLQTSAHVRGLPVLLVHGKSDHVVLVDGVTETAGRLDELGMKTEMRAVAGGHEPSLPAINAIRSFLLQLLPGQVTEDAAWREAEEERRAAELGGGGGVRFGMGGEEEEQMDGWVAEALGRRPGEGGRGRGRGAGVGGGGSRGRGAGAAVHQSPGEVREGGGAAGTWKDWGKDLEFVEVSDHSGGWGEWDDDEGRDEDDDEDEGG